MGRSTLAGLCAIGGAALAVLAAFSYVMPLFVPVFTLPQDAVFLHFHEGRTRFFWIHSPAEPFRIEAADGQAIVWIRSASKLPMLPRELAGPQPPPSFDVPITIGGRNHVPPLGGRWRGRIGPRPRPPWFFPWSLWSVESTFLRLPTWPLVILLMVPPLRRSMAERRRVRRQRRNECLSCGYDLTGLLEPRCPECGVAFARLLA